MPSRKEQLVLLVVDVLATTLLALSTRGTLQLDAAQPRFELGVDVEDLPLLAAAKLLLVVWARRQLARATAASAPAGDLKHQPLLAERSATAPVRRVIGAGGDDSDSDSDSENDEEEGDSPAGAVRCKLHRSAMWVGCALGFYFFAKLIARLVLGTPANDGDGVRENVFWGAVVWACLASALEIWLFRRWLRQDRLDASRARAAAGAGSDADAQRGKTRRAGVADILALCKPDWPLFIVAFCGLTIAAAGESAIPFLFGKIIDSIALDQNTAKFHQYMLYLVLCAAVTGCFTGLRGSTFIIVGARFSARLRQRLFDALLQQEVAFFDTTKTGDITSRLTADTQKVSDNVELNVNVFLRSLLQVFFTLAFMVFISWRMALVAFVSVPLVVLGSKIFGSYMRRLSKRTQKQTARANSVADETVNSITTVKMFAAEEEESARFARAVKKLYRCAHEQAWYYYFYAASTYTFLPYCTSCLVLFYGGKLHDAGQVGGGDLVSFVFYMQSLFSAFSSLGQIYTGLVSAVGAADKVFQWIWRKPKLGAPPPRPADDAEPSTAPAPVAPAVGVGTLRPETCSGQITFSGVTFRYPSRPERTVLRSLSLSVEAGTTLALCGPSGGGKSSCVSLIEHFYTPEEGQVCLDGVPVGELCPRWLHKQVAVVGQEPVLFGRTIRENILFGLLDDACKKTGDVVFEGNDDFDPWCCNGRRQPAPGEGTGLDCPKSKFSFNNWNEATCHAAVIEAAKLANAHEFVCSFEQGYETQVGERGAQLSGGQKQRIAIARALVRKPRVLLLDEATSALDAESEHTVQVAIDHLIAQGNMTVIVIAHRLSTIKHANSIAVIEAGQVVEQGTHDELLRSGGVYEKLVTRQMQKSRQDLKS